MVFGDPVVVEQVAQHLVAGDDAVQGCLDDDGQAHRFVEQLVAEADGLPGQSAAQVAGVAGEDSDGADGVVDGLGSGAEGVGVEGGEVALVVDPPGDHQGAVMIVSSAAPPGSSSVR